MPAKPEASHKAERDAASFEKFNATFFEGFLWSGDETVKVDTAKLIELFDRYFKSEDYPTLDELRETVTFLHSLVLESGEESSYRVYFRTDFDEVSDFFEENLEGSFKAGLDACRNQSRSSKPAYSVRAQKEEEPLPDEPKALKRDYREVQKRIDQLENEKQNLDKRRARILNAFPRLKIAEEQEQSVSGAVEIKEYLPRSQRVETCWKLPKQAMTADETLAHNGARKFSLEDFIKLLETEKAKRRLRLIEAKAEIAGVTLPERKKTPKRSEIESPTKRKRAVQESVSIRRALVKAFHSSHPNIEKLDQSTCLHLDDKEIPVQLKWRTDFRIKTWAEAYNHPKLKDLIHKMFSVDRKKG